MSRRLSNHVRMGLVGGVVLIYLAAVGMIERFNERAVITGVVNLGVIMILATLFMFSFFALKENPDRPIAQPLRAGVTAGAIAGLLPGIVLALVRLLVDGGIDVRAMFLRVTPKMFDILDFNTTPFIGVAVLTGLGGVMGAAAHGFRRLPPRGRAAAITTVSSILIMGLGARLIEPMLEGLAIPTGWLYRSDGLTLVGAIVVAALAVGIRIGLRRAGGFRKAVLGLPGVNQSNVQPILIGLAAVAIAAAPWIGKSFVADVLGSVGVYILLGLGLNIVVGYAGLLDLGYVAFYAVGAYTAALMTARSSSLVGATVFDLADRPLTNFWLALPVTVIVAVVIGVLIGAPVLRLRGDYLAIVTLGFGEIIRVLIVSDWLKPFFGGPQGVTEVADVPMFGANTNDPRVLYYLIVAFALIGFFIATRLKDSRVGRAWAAMREDEDIAEGMGVSVIKYKLLAFAMGAAVGCLGGAFFPAKLGVANPGSFTVLVSINVLAVVVLGGLGSIPGVVVGAAALVGLPELLREFGEYRLHIYGAILIAIMILKPEGLIPDKRRALELHAKETHDATGVLTPAAAEGLQ
ncbi:MAG: ABC transporter permease subunit [Actinomycetota bacterium]